MIIFLFVQQCMKKNQKCLNRQKDMRQEKWCRLSNQFKAFCHIRMTFKIYVKSPLTKSFWNTNSSPPQKKPK